MDLAVFENNNGGDLQVQGQDLALYFGWENMPYLGLFGGNTAESTPSTRSEVEQAFDWWGNNTLLLNQPDLQMNSETERALQNIQLTSSGRLELEEAIKKDLRFMNSFADVTVTTVITSDDRIEIKIRVQQPDNLQDKTFIFIWDATEESLIPIETSPLDGDYRTEDYNDDYRV